LRERSDYFKNIWEEEREMIMRKGVRIGVVTGMVMCLMAVLSNADVSVNWNASGIIPLVDSGGSTYSGTGNLLIQLIIDVGNDTVFSSFESTGQLGVGGETALGGTMSTASDDVVGAWESAYWYNASGSTYAFSSDGVTPFAGQTTVLSDTYASKQFYFRWFDSSTAGGATEAGFIWDTAWTTPAPLATAVDQNIDYATVTASGTGGGTQSGANWATVAAVPEPGTMALFAIGLVTMAVRRRRR
jgi:hypothetical protein